LMAYQQQQGLQATGQMDQQTVSALGIGHGSAKILVAPVPPRAKEAPARHSLAFLCSTRAPPLKVSNA
jgi:hypothetical protein